jgi:predicted DNA-binding helix-hairpin-helix protein
MRGSGIPWFSIPFVVLVACSGGIAAAQDIVPGETARTVQEEEFLERVDDEDASVNVAEILSWLHENPIDLNTARQDELQSIPGITAEEAETILRARENQGEFTSVDELSHLVDGDEILARIRPYVFVHIASAHDRATAHPRSRDCDPTRV